MKERTPILDPAPVVKGCQAFAERLRDNLAVIGVKWLAGSPRVMDILARVMLQEAQRPERWRREVGR